MVDGSLNIAHADPDKLLCLAHIPLVVILVCIRLEKTQINFASVGAKNFFFFFTLYKEQLECEEAIYKWPGDFKETHFKLSVEYCLINFKIKLHGMDRDCTLE